MLKRFLKTAAVIFALTFAVVLIGRMESTTRLQGGTVHAADTPVATPIPSIDMNEADAGRFAEDIKPIDLQQQTLQAMNYMTLFAKYYRGNGAVSGNMLVDDISANGSNLLGSTDNPLKEYFYFGSLRQVPDNITVQAGALGAKVVLGNADNIRTNSDGTQELWTLEGTNGATQLTANAVSAGPVAAFYAPNYINIDTMRSYFQDLSTYLRYLPSSIPTTGSYTDSNNQSGKTYQEVYDDSLASGKDAPWQDYNIDVSKLSPAVKTGQTVVINITAAMLSHCNTLNIYGLTPQADKTTTPTNVVFNVVSSPNSTAGVNQKVNSPTYIRMYSGHQDDADVASTRIPNSNDAGSTYKHSTILWNIYRPALNTTMNVDDSNNPGGDPDVYIDKAKEWVGSILAPNSYVRFNTAIEGSVVAYALFNDNSSISGSLNASIPVGINVHVNWAVAAENQATAPDKPAAIPMELYASSGASTTSGLLDSGSIIGNKWETSWPSLPRTAGTSLIQYWIHLGSTPGYRTTYDPANTRDGTVSAALSGNFEGLSQSGTITTSGINFQVTNTFVPFKMTVINDDQTVADKSFSISTVADSDGKAVTEPSEVATGTSGQDGKLTFMDASDPTKDWAMSPGVYKMTTTTDDKEVSTYLKILKYWQSMGPAISLTLARHFLK